MNPCRSVARRLAREDPDPRARCNSRGFYIPLARAEKRRIRSQLARSAGWSFVSFESRRAARALAHSFSFAARRLAHIASPAFAVVMDSHGDDLSDAEATFAALAPPTDAQRARGWSRDWSAVWASHERKLASTRDLSPSAAADPTLSPRRRSRPFGWFATRESIRSSPTPRGPRARRTHLRPRGCRTSPLEPTADETRSSRHAPFRIPPMFPGGGYRLPRGRRRRRRA